MSRKIKWGIIGLGKIARQFASDMKFVPSGELVAVASRSQEKAEEFGSEFGAEYFFDSYEELISGSQVDAIYIATPHNLHVEFAKKCLQGGKAVLCEKPMATSPVELQSLLDVQKETGVYLMEGMWSYFLPTINKAKEWITEGRIGKLIHLKADFGFPAAYNPQGRLYNPDLAGGAVFDIGIYPLAMTSYFLGPNPKALRTWRHDAPTGVDDDLVMILEYADQIAHLHCSFRSRLSNSLQLIGEEGNIEVPLFWQSRECSLKKDMDVVAHFKDDRGSLGYHYQIQSVCEDLLAEKIASEVMPLERSMNLQILMQQVLSKS